jgi:DNA polymerase III delta prime subunit
VTLLEQLRPKTLKEFIGGQAVKDSIHAYFQGHVDAKAVLLVSDPGLGKTTLAHCFSREYSLVPLEINGSDERNKKDILRIIRAANSPAIEQMGEVKKKLLILDEIEPIRKELLIKILQEKCLKILICNDLSKIHKKVTDLCHLVSIQKPSKYDYKELIDRLGKEIDNETLSQISSWRDCINWYYGGNIRDTKYLTEYSEAEEIFTKGPQRNHYYITTEKLLDFYIHNGGDQQIASLLQLKMSQNTYMKKVVRDVLFSMRLKNFSPISYYGPKKQRPRQKTKFLGFYNAEEI